MQDWAELYALARRIKTMEPWKRISENAIFALVDPITRENGYCVIMGEFGTHLSVAIYLGDEGLRSCIDIQDGYLDDIELYIGQKCLTLSFEDKDLVTPEDRAIYTALGLKFRGRQGYPIFRCYEPGFEPWPLNADQAAFLRLALPKVMQIVSLDAKGDPDYLFPDEDTMRCFTPVNTGDSWAWEESTIPYEMPAGAVVAHRVDELEIRRFAKKYSKGSAALEVDYFYFPAAIMEGPRPFYPRAVMVVDEHGPVLACEVVHHDASIYATVQQQLFVAMEKIGQIPQAVVVQREDLELLLTKYAPVLGFEVQLIDELDAFEEAKDSLFDSLGVDS